ncbi:flagellar hook-basal body complex protein [Butyrivibrio sp. NC2002]|uniref:flagellar hook-basal body complex protein n=1 Tax=Butyrivibrio sp. NC2002 TaxID=1410610 RepID=UPI000690C8A7|nr:flagellar hook-basal body complex protein [Butyrivibrio sp. NC2002]
MMRSLFSGVAGLKTHQVKMDVIGNNIANVNTTSFKSQSITFSDLMYQTTQRASRATETTGGVNARQIGLGAKSGAIATAIEQQGATETTNNPFDMRITGDAFYIVNNGNETLYTRDGSFYVDGAGNLAMQSTGYFVYGWTAVEDEQTGEISVNTNGGIGKLQIMSAENQTYPPEGTTEAVVSGNIDANDTNVTSDAGKTVTLEFYDNLGYLYTAKFAVRDVNDVEHTYSMTLEDILDAKGNTIGAQKLSNVSFTDSTDGNGAQNYPIRASYTKEVTTADYRMSGRTTTKTTYKDSMGQTAYTIPTTGTIEALAENYPGFLTNVYAGTGEVTTGYYEVNSDGTISVFQTTKSDDQSVSDQEFASYYISATSADRISFKGKATDGLSIPQNFSSKEGVSEKKKDILNDLYGIDTDAIFDEYPDATNMKITPSKDGMSANIEMTTTVPGSATSPATGYDFDKVGTDGKSTYTYGGTDPVTYIAIATKGTFNSTTGNFNDLKNVFGLNEADYTAKDASGNSREFSYTIDDDGNITITTKTAVTIADNLNNPYKIEKEFYAKVTASTNTVTYNRVSSGEETPAIALSGTLGTTEKTVLRTVFGYESDSDNVTYELSADGTDLTIYNKGDSETYSIKETTDPVQMDVSVEVGPSTATYTNNSSGKVIYDSIPRSGYVSDLMDATATSGFFMDVYNYATDTEAVDYENLTYNILDDGQVQIVSNYITLKYDAKTGDIVSPEGKIVLNFNQDAIIDGQPKMAGFTDVNMDLSSTTNYNTSATSTIGAVKGDLQSLKTGRSVGEMNGITIGKDGTIYATYSNGQTKLLGQIATAEFANASGLEKQGDNLYASTLNSGEATVQDVTMDGGYITTGVLEMSNVDLSSEFTNMITTQRGFQANSRIITVSDTLLEELTNLKR